MRLRKNAPLPMPRRPRARSTPHRLDQNAAGHRACVTDLCGQRHGGRPHPHRLAIWPGRPDRRAAPGHWTLCTATRDARRPSHWPRAWATRPTSAFIYCQVRAPEELLKDPWPGPVTLVMELSEELNKEKNPFTPFVGIWIPHHAFMQNLAQMFGGTSGPHQCQPQLPGQFSECQGVPRPSASFVPSHSWGTSWEWPEP